MKAKFLLLMLSAALMSITSGCATMISGTSEPVTINSSPDGASITQNGIILGKTPTTISLKREANPVLELSKEGYQKQSVPLNTSFNPWVLSNVIWCMSCVLSTTTDYASGAAWQYAPNHYYSILYPEGTTPSPSDVKKNNARAYIINNYIDIMKAINSTSWQAPSAGQRNDEYLEALFALLEIPEKEKPEAFKKIKLISETAKDIPIFAEDVVKAF